MKKAKGRLTATSLRYILIGILLVLLIGSGAGFVFVYDRLVDYNEETMALNAQIDMSDANLNALQRVQEYLAQHQEDIDNSTKIVAQTKAYRYQDDIINDIYRFANDSGVDLVSISFADTTGGDSGANAGNQQKAPATPQPNAINGLTSKTANVSIGTPVNYSNLLAFIRKIEQNQTKMQIASISLTRGESGNSVTSEAFTIEVYTR